MRTTLKEYPGGEALHHGEVTLAQNRARLTLGVGEGLFSGASVDVGTRLLLRTLAGDDCSGLRHVLDLGCGYGPLGLGLSAMAPDRSVDLMDRDALAVIYAAANAQLNGIEATRCWAGLGWADVPDSEPYDLVVSNIPAKAGPALIDSWLLGGRARLAPEGVIAVVVINRIAPQVLTTLGAAGAEILLQQANREHVAIHYRLPPTGATGAAEPGLALHDRGEKAFNIGKLQWQARTAWGLHEFDSLHHATRLALQTCRNATMRPGGEVGFIGVGVGHLPVAIGRLVEPRRVHLVDRDLLALRMSEANLALSDPRCEVLPHHRAGVGLPGGSLDICLLTLLDKQPQKIVDFLVAEAIAALRPAGRLLLSSTSTVVTRSLESAKRNRLPLELISRRKDKGYSSVDLVRLPGTITCA